MKNLRLMLFLVLGLTLLLPFHSQAQEVAQAVASPGLFQKVADWFQSNMIQTAVVILSTLLAKHGITQIIKNFAARGAVITKEVGELFAGSSTFLATLDGAIKDDGSIEQNSVQELIAAGKTVVAEGKDVVLSIKPKAN